MLSRLQYISQGNSAREQITNIENALKAGCSWVQLRWKNASADDISSLAIKVKKLCQQYKAIFIINDYPEIVQDIDVDGVHLGLKDMSVTEAKKIIGSKKIIGGTANTLEDVLNRVDEQCNYVGLGPFQFTKTKEKLSPVLGLNGYIKILTELQKQQINIPVYAIGGINFEDIAILSQTGIYGVAVSELLTKSNHKEKIVNTIKQHFYETISHC